MKRVFVIALLLGVNLSYGTSVDSTSPENIVIVSVAKCTSMREYLESREEFNKKWETVHGQKPNEKVWKANPDCSVSKCSKCQSSCALPKKTN